MSETLAPRKPSRAKQRPAASSISRRRSSCLCGSTLRKAPPPKLERSLFLGGVPDTGAPAGLGAYLYEDKHWKLGAALSGDIIKPRKESDDSRHLRGLGDIDGTVRGGL